MEIIYRQGSKADLDQLQKLGLASYGPFESILTQENWEKLAGFLKAPGTYTELLSHSTCFVAEKASKIVGMAFLIPKGNPTEIFEANWSYVRMVGVDPGYSGQGIGRQLMERCIQQAKATHETIIALHTSEFMDTARLLYEKMGFNPMKELAPRFGKRYWLYSMALSH